jgi:hypothetical protein
MQLINRKRHVIASVALMVAGLGIIGCAVELSDRGHDYPILVYGGFIMSMIGIAILSLLTWDYLREKLSLKG